MFCYSSFVYLTAKLAHCHGCHEHVWCPFPFPSQNTEIFFFSQQSKVSRESITITIACFLHYSYVKSVFAINKWTIWICWSAHHVIAVIKKINLLVHSGCFFLVFYLVLIMEFIPINKHVGLRRGSVLWWLHFAPINFPDLTMAF